MESESDNEYDNEYKCIEVELPTEMKHQPINININLSKTNYFRDYYKNNNEEVECTCGMMIKKRGKCKHIKSKKHQLLLEIKVLKLNE